MKSRIIPFLLLSALCAMPLTAQGQGKRVFGAGNPFTMDELPAGALKAKLKKLRPQARAEALKRLHNFSFPESDAAKHLKVDDNGGVFIVCPINGCDQGCSDHSHGHADVGSTGEGDSIAAGDADNADEGKIPIGDGTNETFNPGSPVPVSAPPAFHSKPGAPFHIYLDFNGAYVTGKQWTYTDGTTTWSTWDCAAWSTDGDAATFSVSEQNDIRRMWERIAEDYAPFNVNVTTDAAYDPDNYTGDRNKVGWLLTTPTTDKNGVRCPHYGYGGVAYVNVFGNSNYFSSYQPAWVTPMGTANTAEAASHEMGHNMGLSHDGLTTGAAYYGGHVATSSAPSWGPIMGTGYNRNVSQWSKTSEYLNGNQAQDDLNIIAGKVTYRADDHGDTFQSATAWAQSPVKQPGVVENTGDPDVFTFTTGAGPISFSANTYRCDTQTWGANLDAVLELYDSTQTLIASGNPLADTNTSISTSVPAGTYYLVLKPTGTGNPLGSPPSGYSVYGSLGNYSITGTYSAVDSIFVTAPNGGESWVPGTSAEITWASGVGGNVSIELFKGGSFHSIISSSTPNDGSFLWPIPSAQELGSDYKIRITSLSNPGITADGVSDFSIVPDVLAAALDITGYTWVTSGNTPWFQQTATTYDGIDAAQSGSITHDQQSSISTTLAGPGTLTFRWKVSSESNYDFLRFVLNGVEQAGSLKRISGEVNWVQKTVVIPAGNNTVEWRYTKDFSVDTGSDAAWLDQVSFISESVPGSLAVTPAGGLAASGNYGGTFTPSSLQYTLSNPGSTPVNWTAGKTQGWVTLSPASGTLAAGANTTVTATINAGANALNVGSYSDMVSFTNTTNGSGNTTRSVGLTVTAVQVAVSLGNLNQTYDGNPKPVSVTTNPTPVANSVTYIPSGIPVNAGTYPVTATVTEPNHTGSASGSLVIAKGTQTIAFTAPHPVGDDQPPFDPGATASSGLPVSYSSSNTAVATVSGTSVTIVGPGTTEITASQAGDSNREAAAPVKRTLTVFQTNLAEAVVYEPFDDTDPTLEDNIPGKGISGTWAGNAEVTADTLVFGNLSPGSGGKASIGNQGGHASVGSTLSNSGLLDDGETLWFSVIVETGGDIATNGDLGFALGTDPIGAGNDLPIANSGTALGFTFKNNQLRASHWTNTLTRSTTNSGNGASPETRYLVVGRITWGASSDMIELYMPAPDLTQGAVVSSFQTDVAQSLFDTVSFSSKAATPGHHFDEIRFGASYESVIGIGVPGVDHFAISAVPSPQTVGTPITGITITAQDSSNATVSGFSGTVTFGGTGGFSGTSANFNGGVLTDVSVIPTVAGSDLTFTVDDGEGHTGMAIIHTIGTKYVSWAGGSNFNEDDNGDGIENGLAWVLGAEDAEANVTGLLPTLSAEAGGIIFSFKRNQESIDANTAVVIETGTTLGSWPDSYVVGATTAASTAGVTVLKDTPASGTDTITLTLEQSPGAMFARLKVSQEP
jgi:hypothetical protein